MHGLDSFDTDSDGTVFRDVIMLALLGFAAIVMLLLPHLNPPVEVTAAAPPPGNVQRRSTLRLLDSSTPYRLTDRRHSYEIWVEKTATETPVSDKSPTQIRNSKYEIS